MKNSNIIAKIAAVLLILVLASALTACGKPAKDVNSAAEADKIASEKTVPTAEAVQNVEKQIDDLDTIDKDLDISDLDALDKELDLQI